MGLSRNLVLRKLEGQLAVLARVKGSEDMQSALEFEIDQLPLDHRLPITVRADPV